MDELNFAMKCSGHSCPANVRRLLLLALLPVSVLTLPALHAGQTVQLSNVCSINVYESSDSDLTDEEKFPEDYKNSVISPGPNQLQLLQLAFAGLPEFACKAVNRVAFVKKKKGKARAWVGSKFPDLLMVVAPDEQEADAVNGLDYFPTEDRLMLRGESLQMVDPNTNEQMPVSAVLQAKLEIWS
ncbi:MAG: hypothetical protein R3330_14985, partial [Saprospiraceae bacterium]|nr:hypothetical protein [Saprospiraceae bacterium]